MGMAAQHNQTMKPRLTGVVRADGECARCNREIGKVYEVLLLDGSTATYGRRCCAKVTGYSGDLDKAAKFAVRAAVVASRWVAVAEAFPGLVEGLGAWTELTTPWAVVEVVVNDRLWDGHDAHGHRRGWGRWQSWREACESMSRA